MPRHGFAAVVYEMVTRKRTFEGKSQASVMAAMIERDRPPMSTLRPMTPPALDRAIVRECPIQIDYVRLPEEYRG